MPKVIYIEGGSAPVAALVELFVATRRSAMTEIASFIGGAYSPSFPTSSPAASIRYFSSANGSGTVKHRSTGGGSIYQVGLIYYMTWSVGWVTQIWDGQYTYAYQHLADGVVSYGPDDPGFTPANHVAELNAKYTAAVGGESYALGSLTGTNLNKFIDYTDPLSLGYIRKTSAGNAFTYWANPSEVRTYELANNTTGSHSLDLSGEKTFSNLIDYAGVSVLPSYTLRLSSAMLVGSVHPAKIDLGRSSKSSYDFSYYADGYAYRTDQGPYVDSSGIRLRANIPCSVKVYVELKNLAGAVLSTESSTVELSDFSGGYYYSPILRRTPPAAETRWWITGVERIT